MNRRHIPNLITVFRFLLVPPVVVLLLDHRDGAALGLFTLAGVSDAMDGFLAKRFGWTSRLGGLLDPLADKALLIASYVTLGWLALIPPWLVVLVILRDVVILAGAVTYHFCIERLDAAPRLLSKLNTVAQLALVLAVMFSLAVTALPAAVMQTLVWAVLLTTVASGADYVWIWSRRALRRGARP